MNCTAVRRRPTCTDCKREFVRVQEFKRHLKDKHEPRRQCPFCNFRWTRPDVIKAHLLAKHRPNFTAELLVRIQALRGQRIVAFLDGYDYGSNVEVAFHFPLPWTSPILMYRQGFDPRLQEGNVTPPWPRHHKCRNAP